MDELLSIMEEDLGFDAPDPEDDSSIPDPSCRRLALSPLKNQNNASSKSSQELTFKDVFGSPDKRDLKDFGLSKPKTAPRKSLDLDGTGMSTSSSLSKDLELRRAIKQDKNVPYKPDSSLVVMDPYSRLRLVKSSISIYHDETVTAEAVLKERNIGLEFVSLLTFPVWYRQKGKDCKNFWVSGVLSRKTAGVRKSSNGNDYSIWEINDLKNLENSVTIFLFGSSTNSSTTSPIPVGSVIDITCPSLMPNSGSSQTKFSVNNANQVRFIGSAKDFGICQGKKKDGNKCSAVVNTWECSFCIHHASKELKKMNGGGGGKGRPGKGLFPNKSFSFGGMESTESLKQQGIVIADFGRPPSSSQPSSSSAYNKSFGGAPPLSSKGGKVPPKQVFSSRMELQGSTNEMKKNPLRMGNHETVKFVKKDPEHPLLQGTAQAPVARKALDLNPMKTRHLTNRDRELLQMLGDPGPSSSKVGKKEREESPASAPVSDLIATAIVSNPNAAGRNFLQFLSLQHAPKDQVDLSSDRKTSTIAPLTMTRDKLQSMKKALAFVQQNGPIRKSDPNSASRKRKLEGPSTEPGPSKKKGPSSKPKIDIEFDFESEELKQLINAKSAHDDELDSLQQEEYFGKLEKKEALEEKLLSTFSIETKAVLCRKCNYVAQGQSEFCKEQGHEIRLVKARKRFFKCKDCGNRTTSLDRLPKRPCSNCNASSWLVAPVGRERKGPTLPSEMLAVRGHEEKFMGAGGSKVFLHLEV